MEGARVLAIVSRVVTAVRAPGCRLSCIPRGIEIYSLLFSLQVLAVILIIVAAATIGIIDNNEFFDLIMKVELYSYVHAWFGTSSTGMRYIPVH